MSVLTDEPGFEAPEPQFPRLSRRSLGSRHVRHVERTSIAAQLCALASCGIARDLTPSICACGVRPASRSSTSRRRPDLEEFDGSNRPALLRPLSRTLAFLASRGRRLSVGRASRFSDLESVVGVCRPLRARPRVSTARAARQTLLLSGREFDADFATSAAFTPPRDAA